MDEKQRNIIEIYENGKHRRYNLLFAVNGGAFAISKLLSGDAQNPAVGLGGLSLTHISVGMIFFTVVMMVDIWEFGDKMKKNSTRIYLILQVNGY